MCIRDSLGCGGSLPLWDLEFVEEPLTGLPLEIPGTVQAEVGAVSYTHLEPVELLSLSQEVARRLETAARSAGVSVEVDVYKRQSPCR